MKEWLLSIVGVVFLGVLFDLLYPSGKTNTLCKSLFGFFALFVMISPLFQIDLEKISSTFSSNEILNININEARNKSYELKIINHLNDCDIVGVNVEIESNIYNDEFVINNIFVDSTNLVLTENVTNINKYEVIAKEIANVVEIDLERIVVYG